jgi:regulator of sigma D
LGDLYNQDSLPTYELHFTVEHSHYMDLPYSKIKEEVTARYKLSDKLIAAKDKFISHIVNEKTS